MKPQVVDVNIWLAILLHEHTHHKVARDWFESVPTAGAGMCRVVQLSMMRLLGNPRVAGKFAMPALDAWNILQSLIDDDERVVFLPEPAGMEGFLPLLLRYPRPTGQLIPDAYLCAFAMAAYSTLVTLDQGFRQFRDLDMVLLGLRAE